MKKLATEISVLVLMCFLFTSRLEAVKVSPLPAAATLPKPSTQDVLPTPLISVPPLTAENRLKLEDGCEAAANYSKSLLGHAVLVLRGGEIIFERYDNGWKQDLPHGLASGTKSFVGAVAAAAVEDGLMTWDELACETLTEWKDHPKKNKITARHLLNLSSGLDPSNDLLSRPFRSKAPNLFLAAINVPSKHDAGTRFEYGPSHFYAYGEFLQRKIELRNETDPAFKPSNFAEYMYSRVLDPIGVKVGGWGTDRERNLNLPGGARLIAREWARFGEFIREQGHIRDVNGERKSLIKWSTLTECFKPSAKNPGYGLTWWLLNPASETSSATVADGEEKQNSTNQQRKRLQNALRETLIVRNSDGSPIEIFMAAGKGRQRLYVIPSYGLSIVRFAEDGSKGATFSNQKFLEPILETLEPIDSSKAK